jgi:hypothetical protein
VETHTNIHAGPESPVKAGAIAAEPVTRVDIRNESSIRIQMSDLKLIAKQVELSLGEVE